MDQGSGQGNQEQRFNSVMEDTNAMTIEFLRVRLLAERAVSKSARDKADELGRRVAELEEQLKMVSVQRKKAEKATADILAILEENGYTDISETFDSISEHESFSETKRDKSSSEAEERSVDSKVKSIDKDESSASENGSFLVHSQSLSWKGRKSESNSSEKLRDSLRRRQRSCGSVHVPSPKPRHGKSCRQIKRKESRANQNTYVSNEKEAETSSKVFPRSMKETTPDTLTEGSEELQCEEGLQEALVSNCLGNEIYPDTDMERALEQQQKLIGRFEDMERVQREWEEKFREIKVSTVDSSDLADHSDVTEENDETKTQAPHQGVLVVSMAQMTRSSPAEGVQSCDELIKTQTNVLSIGSEPSERNEYNAGASQSFGEDFTISGRTCERNLEILGKQPIPLKSSQTADGLPSAPVSSSYKEATGTNKGSYALETSNGCNSVLDALKQAKMSLQEKVHSLPLSKAESVKGAFRHSLSTARTNPFALPAEPSSQTADIRRMIEIPMGCAGLFRVPTETSAESSKTKTLSGSQLSLRNHYPDTGITLSSSDRLFTEVSSRNLLNPVFQSSLPSQFWDTSSPFDPSDRLPTTPYVGGTLLRSGFPTADQLRPHGGVSNVSISPISSEGSGFTGNVPIPTNFYLQGGPRRQPIRDGFPTFYRNRSMHQTPSHLPPYYDTRMRYE